LEREELWIKRLVTKTPHGLNKQDWSCKTVVDCCIELISYKPRHSRLNKYVKMLSHLLS
jgi:hypothetical protein